MTRAEVALVVFRRFEAWLIDHTPDGFPPAVDGLYATETAREWVRARHGLAPVVDDSQAAERRMMERMRNGAGKRSVSRSQTA